MSRSDQETLERLTWGSAQVQAEVRSELAAGLERDPKTTLPLVMRMLRLAAKERSGQPLRQDGGLACIEVLAASLPLEDPLPTACDDVLAFTADHARARTLFLRIPMARRIAMFDSWIRDGSWSKYLMPYLDLAPEGAEPILADAVARGTLRETLGWEGFQTLRKTDSGLDAIVKRYEAILATEAPPAPPKPRRRGSFSFVDPVAVTPADYDALDDVSKSQYRQSAGAYVGVREVKNPRDFIRLLKRDELDESDAEMRRWKVMRGKKHVYDLWVVWVENGSFFHAGSTTRVPVHIVQDTYEALVDDADARDLAEDLAASAKRSLWTMPAKTKPKTKAKTKPKTKAKTKTKTR